MGRGSQRTVFKQAYGMFFDLACIVSEEDRGLPGFINLVGIESPGLTCSPIIAMMAAGTVDEILG